MGKYKTAAETVWLILEQFETGEEVNTHAIGEREKISARLAGRSPKALLTDRVKEACRILERRGDLEYLGGGFDPDGTIRRHRWRKLTPRITPPETEVAANGNPELTLPVNGNGSDPLAEIGAALLESRRASQNLQRLLAEYE